MYMYCTMLKYIAFIVINNMKCIKHYIKVSQTGFDDGIAAGLWF